MPSYFHYRSPEKNWDAPLKTERCSFLKANGQQCKRHVTMGIPFCFQHRLQNKVRVEKSRIPHSGLGLFAHEKGHQDIVFKPKEKIAPYSGEYVDNKTILTRYGSHTAPYGLKLNAANNLDGATRRGLGTLANHQKTQKSNARFSVAKGKNEAYLVATKRIREGDEIYVNYGSNYKMNEPGVYYSTNRAKKKV